MGVGSEAIPQHPAGSDRLRPCLKGRRLPIAGPAARRAAGRGRRRRPRLPRRRVRRPRRPPGTRQLCVRAPDWRRARRLEELDRLGRTLAHLVNTVQDLSTRGVGLRVLTGQGAQIDTTTTAGRLVFGIFAALAEFERELIRERTLAGLTAARARGRNGGRMCLRCRKPRCGWPRLRWRTVTRPCQHSAANSGSGP